MNRKHLLAIASIILMAILLFTAYNSNMHIIRPRGVTAASGGGIALTGGGFTLGMGSYETFESVIEMATDVVVAEFVTKRSLQGASEYEFIVHERVFGNAPDRIFAYVVYAEMSRGFAAPEFRFTTGTQYLLALTKLADVYSRFHEGGFTFATDLILDLNDPSRSTMSNEPLSMHSRMNFNSRNLTSESIVSYVRTLSRAPFETAGRVYITSNNLEDIINGSPYVLVVEINEPNRIAREGMRTDIYYATVAEVLKGDMQVGDLLRVVFFAGTVFPGETHIVSITPTSPTNPNPYFHSFTSRQSLHSMSQRNEIAAIISGTPPTPTPVITFGTVSGAGAAQTLPVHISEPIPEGAQLVVFRSSPGIWGTFSSFENPATASNDVMICDRVIRLDAFLVSCVSSFIMTADFSTVYVQDVWFRPAPTPTPTPTPTPPPVITFGTVSGTGIGQSVPVHISGSMPEGSYLVVFRSSPGTWGPFWGIDIPATASSHVMICDRVSRLDVFLVSCWSSFMMETTNCVKVCTGHHAPCSGYRVPKLNLIMRCAANRKLSVNGNTVLCSS